MLTAPESQVMSPGKVIGLLNGLYSLIEHGLVLCDDGFGAVGGCSSPASGHITYQPEFDSGNIATNLAVLLTAGRMSQDRHDAIQQFFEDYNAEKAYHLALKLLVTAPEFHSTACIDSQSMTSPALSTDDQMESATPEEGGYKAVIHLFLDGGCDSFNMLVPHSTCGLLHQEYLAARGSIALSDSQVLPIDGTKSSQPCTTFGIHRELSFLKFMYDDGDLLFLANIGVLTEPVNVTDYLDKTRTRLFAHDAMREEVKLLDPMQSEAGTGALGRLADVLQHSGFKTSRVVVDTAANSLAGRSSSPTVMLDENVVARLNADPGDPILGDIVNNDLRGSMLGELWSTILGQSLNQTEDLVGLLGDLSSSPDFLSKSSLGKKLELIHELIAARDVRAVDRDVFFVSMRGYDTHTDSNDTLQLLFQEKNTAIQEFVDGLKALGVWEDVVIVQSSEFGRTLNGNTGAGTDHAWGGNSWVAGGSVRGGRILGNYPATLTGERDTILDRGRLIPTLPWDAVINAIADWMGGAGLNDQQLDYVLPNRAQFSNLFLSDDLFASSEE